MTDGRGRRAAGARRRRRRRARAGRARRRGWGSSPRPAEEPLARRARATSSRHASSAWPAAASSSARSTRWPAQEYEEAVAHVEELEAQRGDLEDALAELEGLIKETDRRIRESFEETFEAAATQLRGRRRSTCSPAAAAGCGWCSPTGPRPVLGGEDARGRAASRTRRRRPTEPEPGVEVEVTPAGKSTKRLSLLSGGEKSLVALAFMFAVFLARPCPFYILDEVEAALDDINIDRFLELVRRYSRPRPVHRRHPPEAHDGRRRQPLRGEHGRRRRVAGGLAQAGGAAARTKPPPSAARLAVRGAAMAAQPGASWPDLAGAVTATTPPGAAEPRSPSSARLLPPAAGEHDEDARGPRRRAAGHRCSSRSTTRPSSAWRRR